MAYPNHNDTVVVKFVKSPRCPDTLHVIPANTFLKARYDTECGEWLWVEWAGVKCLVALMMNKRPLIIKYVGDK